MSDTLNKSDIAKWIKETFIFSIPAILAFLVAFQNGADVKFALGAGYSALVASLINLYGKYKAGTPNLPTKTVVTPEVTTVA